MSRAALLFALLFALLGPASGGARAQATNPAPIAIVSQLVAAPSRQLVAARVARSDRRQPLPRGPKRLRSAVAPTPRPGARLFLMHRSLLR
jgi:hypothetical protein